MGRKKENNPEERVKTQRDRETEEQGLCLYGYTVG